MSSSKVTLPAAVTSRPDFFAAPTGQRAREVMGWYIERPSVDWTGEILNVKTGELVKEPSMTKQSFKEECDINNIVRRFEATGIIDHVNAAAAQGVYEDLPSGLDLQAGLEMIRQAETAFMALPASARAEFNNDPVAFVEAFQNPTEAQQERFIALGLATDRRPPKAPPESPKPSGEGSDDK